MSLLSAAGVAIAGQVEDIILRQGRRIATIIPQVVVEENHRDEMVITSHPVQKGATITDHAYKQPAQLSLRYGWSNSGAAFTLDVGFPSVNDVYQALLDLQASRKPFDVITAKRKYKNMLIRSLDVVTDVTTQNAVMVEILLQQITIVDVQSAALDPKFMKMYEKHAPTINAGVKQAKPVPESVLDQGAGLARKIIGAFQ